jgi:hypothetical protein
MAKIGTNYSPGVIWHDLSGLKPVEIDKALSVETTMLSLNSLIVICAEERQARAKEARRKNQIPAKSAA